MMGGEWRFGDVRESFNRGFILRKQSAAKNKSSWLLRYEVKRGARVSTGSTLHVNYKNTCMYKNIPVNIGGAPKAIQIVARSAASFSARSAQRI